MGTAMSKLKKALLILLLSTCGACGSTNMTIRESLDPVTAVTVTRSSEPVLFYQDHSSRAAYARDYVNLGPFQVNRMGDYRYYLWLGIWTTLPVEISGDQRDGFESVTLFANGEPLTLRLAGWTPSAFGGSDDVYLKSVASAADAYYEVTFDQIRLIAASSDLRLLTSGTYPISYELWDSQRSAMNAFREFLERSDY
jgi:hypothetical protein